MPFMLSIDNIRGACKKPEMAILMGLSFSTVIFFFSSCVSVNRGMFHSSLAFQLAVISSSTKDNITDRTQHSTHQ